MVTHTSEPAMSTRFEEWLAAHVHELLTCPRCDTTLWFDDGRCVLCGMTRFDQGPAPIRNLQGIQP